MRSLPVVLMVYTGSHEWYITVFHRRERFAHYFMSLRKLEATVSHIY